MNRRISFLVTNIDPNVGGTERVTYTLYENFKTIGYTPFLIYCGKDNDQIPTSKKLKISLNSSADTISTSISDYVKKNSIDIIVVVNRLFHSAKYLKALKRVKKNTGTKLIFSLHAAPDNWVNKNNRELVLPKVYVKELIKSLIYKFWNPHFHSVRAAFNLSDRFLVLSDSYIKSFIDTYKIKNNVEKLIAVPNPVPFLDPYNKKEKDNIVLIVSRMQEDQKRIYAALKIWKCIAKNNQDWKLIIVGDGPDLSTYKNYAKDIDNIVFEGHSNNVSKYYRIAKVFMMTSIWEGLPMTLIEAMHYGCIPIVFDSFAAVHDIIDEEVTGFIIPNNDYWTYEKKLDCLLHDCDMQEKMCKNILSITNRFSINNIMGKWKNELDNLI